MLSAALGQAASQALASMYHEPPLLLKDKPTATKAAPPTSNWAKGTKTWVRGLHELQHVLTEPAGEAYVMVHAIWHAAGHTRALLYWNIGDGGGATPLHYGLCTRGAQVSLDTVTKQAAAHLSLRPGQEPLVCTYRLDAGGPLCTDVTFVAHDNAQAAAWSTLTTSSKVEPRWLTREMLKSGARDAELFARGIPGALAHVEACMDFVEHHQVCVNVCDTGPVYTKHGRWPRLHDPGTYAIVGGAAVPDLGTSHLHRTQSAHNSVEVGTEITHLRADGCTIEEVIGNSDEESEDGSASPKEALSKPLKRKAASAPSRHPPPKSAHVAPDLIKEGQQYLVRLVTKLNTVDQGTLPGRGDTTTKLRAIHNIVKAWRKGKGCHRDEATPQLRACIEVFLQAADHDAKEAACPSRTGRMQPKHVLEALQHTINALERTVACATGMRTMLSHADVGDYPRTETDLNQAFAAVRASLTYVPVRKLVYAVVGLQGTGKSTLLRAVSQILAAHAHTATVVLEDVEGFAPELSAYLQARVAGEPREVIQPLAYATQLKVWATHMAGVDLAGRIVVERCAVCTFAFSLVLFMQGHLTHGHLAQLCATFEASGYLPAGITFLDSAATTCMERVKARAGSDPKRADEATTPLQYFEELVDAHKAVYGAPELHHRSTLRVGQLPDKDSQPDEYADAVTACTEAVIGTLG